MKNNQIKRAIDTSLSSLRITERDVQRIMTQVREGKQVKKKLSVGVVVALLLIMLTVTAVGVGLMTGMKYWDASGGDLGSPLDMAELNGRIYLLSEDVFFEWNPSEEKATVLTDWPTLQQLDIDPVLSLLFAHDDSIMLLSQNGQLWRLDAMHWRKVQNFADSPLMDYVRSENTLVCQDGYLFVPGRESENLTQYLLRMNLTDGSVDQLQVGNVLRLCGYRNGNILAFLRTDSSEERLVLIDTESGEIEAEMITMHALAMNGLAYDEESDHIYAMVDGALSVWDGLKWHELCKGSLPGLTHSYCVVDDLYVAASPYGIQSIQIGEQTETKALTIRGLSAFSSTLDHGFQQSHPNLPVSRSTEGHFCAKEAEEAIRAGDKTDLFHIVVDTNWLPLLKSGLLEPIGSETLTKEAEEMSESFQQLTLQDGALYAVPSTATVIAWKPLASDTPLTYHELFMQDNTALTWTSQRWSQEQYIEAVLEQQIAENGAQFDTASFRASLFALKAASWDNRTQAVFNTSTGFLMGNQSIATGTAAPIRIDADSPERYPMYLYLYILNPNSENKEAALAFLEYAACETDGASRAMFAPETAQPVLLPFAEQWIEDVKIQHAQDVQDGLLPNDPAALEERIENIRHMPGHMLVTRQNIDLYRQSILPKLDLQMHPLISWHSKEAREQMKNEILRYLADELTLDQTIDSLNALAEKEK